jgi:hypothetical protein
MSDLAELYHAEGKYALVEQLYTRILDVRRRVMGGEHGATLTSLDDLGGSMSIKAKYAQAEPLYTKALQLRRRIHAEQHADTLGTRNNLALLYRK